MVGNQRWRDRKATFRRPEEQIRKAEYDVATLAETKPAKAFVEHHHYSGTFPSSRFRFGLFRKGELVGVANFGVPIHSSVVTKTFGCGPNEGVELNRFVLLDEVPGNGESWFLARCREQLRKQGMLGIVSFSDPVPRTDDCGEMVFPGHIGTIYQASNARFLGRSKARTLRILPDGTVFSERAISKIRSLDQGWVYAVKQLVAHGAEGDEMLFREKNREVNAEWLSYWLRLLTRPLKHTGNHRYAWSLQRSVGMPEGQPYPKRKAA